MATKKRCSVCGERPCECLRMDVGHATVYFTDPDKVLTYTVNQSLVVGSIARLPLAQASKGEDILWLEGLYKLEDTREEKTN